MPAIAPRVLKNAANVDVTYNPAALGGNKATFVDQTNGRFADQSVLTEITRPTSSSNDGHKFTVNLALPHPLLDQDGCCINKDAPPSSYLAITTLASKHATGAQIDDLIARTRSYVASAAFAALVKGGNNY